MVASFQFLLFATNEATGVLVISKDIPWQTTKGTTKPWVTMPLLLDLPAHWLDLKNLRLAHTGADKSPSISPQRNVFV